MTHHDAFVLADIDLAASPRVRVTDNPGVVHEYAEAMRAGHVFPPITIYRVNGVALVVDGRHRIAAAAEIGRPTLVADVYEGTLAEAAWAGAAANRTNGQSLTMLDRTCCVRLLLVACPEKVQHEIAEQVGCSVALVSKVAGRLRAEAGGTGDARGRQFRSKEGLERIRELFRAGLTSVEIRYKLHAHPTRIAAVRREMGLVKAARTEEAFAQRIARTRELADQGWTAKQIAAEVGQHPDTIRHHMREFGIAARSRPVPAHIRSPVGRRGLSEARAQEIAQQLRDGVTVHAIAKRLHVSSETVAAVREHWQIPRARSRRTREAQERRLEQIRTMAAEGYTTRQIAGTVKLGRDHVRNLAKMHGIDIGADRVVGLTHRHNPTRIVDRIVQDAENLTAGAELIVYKDLDPSQLATWIQSLLRSREQLGAFIRRLMQEQPHEASESVSA